MSSYQKKPPFIETIEGIEFRQGLVAMVASTEYSTGPSYSANEAQYPDHSMPFVDKHMHYITKHPEIDPTQYLSNLRLMTRIR